MINKNEYFKELEGYQRKGLELMMKKNQDYCGNISPFKNFDIVESILNISSEKGIMVRICDKVARAGQLLDNEAEVKDEKLEDTLLDLSNYALILLARISERKKAQNKPVTNEKPYFDTNYTKLENL